MSRHECQPVDVDVDGQTVLAVVRMDPDATPEQREAIAEVIRAAVRMMSQGTLSPGPRPDPRTVADAEANRHLFPWADAEIVAEPLTLPADHDPSWCANRCAKHRAAAL